jgi:hypothetical protein
MNEEAMVRSGPHSKGKEIENVVTYILNID